MNEIIGNCPKCKHPWHGLHCTYKTPVRGVSYPCDCESSFVDKYASN